MSCLQLEGGFRVTGVCDRRECVVPDYYEVLNLPRGAVSTAIEQAYYRLLEAHQGNEPALRQVQEAYFTLSNPLTRKRYDLSLAAAPSPPAAPLPPVGSQPPVLSTGEPPKRAQTELIEVPATGVRPSAAPHPPVARRPSTEPSDSHPSPPRRAVTELVETMVSARPAARPATEAIDVSQPPVARPTRPPTEANAPAAARPGARPATEYVDFTQPPATVDPAAGRSGQPVPLGPFRVVITLPNSDTFQVELGDGRHIIGRPSKNGPEPAVRLDNRFVSREHATLVKEGDSLVIIDSHSVNGTRLNGQRLAAGQPYPLNEADRLEIEDFVLHIVFS